MAFDTRAFRSVGERGEVEVVKMDYSFMLGLLVAGEDTEIFFIIKMQAMKNEIINIRNMLKSMRQLNEEKEKKIFKS
jgi:hypothetical protein